MKRQRGRNRNKNRNNNPNRSYDSQGPEVKVRGNPQTVYERYIQLATDARSSGNRVRAENLLQHAEHYLRLNQEIQAAKDKRDGERGDNHQNHNQGQASHQNGDDDQPRARKTRNRRRDRDDDRYDGGKSDSSNSGPDTTDVPLPTADFPLEVKPIKKPRKAPSKASGKADALSDDDASDAKSTRRRRAPSRKSEPAAE